MIAVMLIGWIYIGLRALYEEGKGSASDAKTESWARSMGYKGYYNHNNKWIDFK